MVMSPKPTSRALGRGDRRVARFRPSGHNYLPQADVLGLIPQWAAEAENALPAHAKKVITRSGLLIRTHGQ